MKNVCLPMLAAAMLFSSLCLAACEAPKKADPARPAKPFIGVLLYREDDIYISMVSAAIRGALEDRATVEVLAAKSDQLTQIDQIEGLLAKKAQALAVNLVDPQAAALVADKAKKIGIPVIFFNREPDLASIKSYAGRTCFVGTKAADAGKLQGDIIKKLWDEHPVFDRNKDGKFQYIMLQANTDNPEAVARTEYSVRQAMERGVPMVQIGQTYMCDWNEDLARQAVLLALASHGEEMELVIANNDSMALGAIAALAAYGYNTGNQERFIPVVGVDAIPQAIEAIQKGVMSATVKQDAEAMGKTVAAILLNAVAGKGLLEGIPYAWDESGIAVRIPYAPYEGK